MTCVPIHALTFACRIIMVHPLVRVGLLTNIQMWHFKESLILDTCLASSVLMSDLSLVAHKMPKSDKMSISFSFYRLWHSVAGEPYLHDIAAKFACLFPWCCRLCSTLSCFDIHFAHILWYPRSSWMMEYADPRLMSNLSSVSVTVIRLSSWTRALTHSTLSAIHEVVGRPKHSS
jgi:hypothetical protein